MIAGSIVLNLPMIDGYRITSWQGGFDRLVGEALGYEKRLTGVTWHDRRIMQYDGLMIDTGSGTAFVGAGLQAGRQHHMIEIKGFTSDLMWDELRPYLNSVDEEGEGWSATRIDLQVTVPEPDTWSQLRFFNRMHRAGKSPGYPTPSRDRNTGELMETVYVGSRSSSRFIRVYRKLDDRGRKLLRLEVEFKGDRAKAVAAKLSRLTGEKRTEFISQCLLFEVQRTIGDAKLEMLYSGVLTHGSVKIPVGIARSAKKTEAWLLGQVLKAFEKYINDHDSDGRVKQAFRDAIDKCERWG